MKLVGERRALAAIVFAFYFLVYAMLVMLGFVQPGAEAFMTGIAGVYGLAFFALVAGYFWARWYAVGVGLYGVMMAAVGLWQARGNPALEDAVPLLMFVGITHLAAALLLWGNAMSEPYDGQTAWRERFHMDDSAVQRLGRSVIRAGASLPLVIAYGLAPKPDTASTILAFLAFGLTAAGFRAMVRARTWGVLAVGAAGGLLMALAATDLAMGSTALYALRPALGGALLLSATVPFFAPIARFVAAR